MSPSTPDHSLPRNLSQDPTFNAFNFDNPSSHALFGRCFLSLFPCMSFHVFHQNSFQHCPLLFHCRCASSCVDRTAKLPPSFPAFTHHLIRLHRHRTLPHHCDLPCLLNGFPESGALLTLDCSTTASLQLSQGAKLSRDSTNDTNIFVEQATS